MRHDLESVLTTARTLPPEELPGFLGGLEEIRVTAMLRLSTPPAPADKDELLGIEEAARRLSICTSYLYRHHAQLNFTRRVGRRLLFSAQGIEQYIRRRRP